MSEQRRFTLTDNMCLAVDQTLRTLFGTAKTSGRAYPAKHLPHEHLDLQPQKHSAGLMRVNHTGEVCAQALYHAQGLVSRTPALKLSMQQAAIEEGDHLAWCQQRLNELHSQPSYLNPLWYAGSFGLGLAAGVLGDKWSLGFVAETERQVVEHLAQHRQLLPATDLKSQKILAQMQQDEAEHQHAAIAAGARILPPIIQTVMRFMSKVMVKVTYWI
jgi:ubiquinone biosynthesis monooxygenase Coq7